MKKKPHLLLLLLGCFLNATLLQAQPIQNQSSLKNNQKGTTDLTVTINNKSAGICSKSMANCAIYVSTNACMQQNSFVTITNNSKVPALGITASSTDSNFRTYVVTNNSCPTSLKPGASCSISFYSKTAASFITSNISVKGTNTNATFFNMYVFQCGALLTIPKQSTIPVNSGLGTLKITNATSPAITAHNVHAVLPSTWTGVVQNSSNCATLPPGGSCTITFSSTTPYLAQKDIRIAGDNLGLSNFINVAFTLSGYLVFSISTNPEIISAGVIDTTDLPSLTQWGNNVITSAVDLIDGYGNTLSIMSTPGIGANAAANCYNSTRGGAPVGTWYLPAICEIAGVGTTPLSANCPAGIDNVDTNLYQLGFGALATDRSAYWSSTESTENPAANAWAQNFFLGDFSQQIAYGKFNPLRVRCIRSISY